MIPKSKTSYVPYLGLAWLTEKFPEPLPCGLARGMSAEEIAGRLGSASGTRLLDSARDVVLSADPRSVAVAVDEARELTSRHGVPAKPVVGVFVAWAALRVLLDETRLAGHAGLLTDVRDRERSGSELAEAAFPRGLWDRHLKNLPGLRDFAYKWFHNIGGGYVRDDMVAVFGSRTGPYGHDEPVLDDDGWDKVERAAPALDVRFAEWVGKPGITNSR